MIGGREERVLGGKYCKSIWEGSLMKCLGVSREIFEGGVEEVTTPYFTTVFFRPFINTNFDKVSMKRS